MTRKQTILHVATTGTNQARVMDSFGKALSDHYDRAEAGGWDVESVAHAMTQDGAMMCASAILTLRETEEAMAERLREELKANIEARKAAAISV
jgi:hypothetical protein